MDSGTAMRVRAYAEDNLGWSPGESLYKEELSHLCQKFGRSPADIADAIAVDAPLGGAVCALCAGTGNAIGGAHGFVSCARCSGKGR